MAHGRVVFDGSVAALTDAVVAEIYGAGGAAAAPAQPMPLQAVS